MNNYVDICYLCGEQVGNIFDRDHIPPKQFYARELRRKYSPNLYTLPVHPDCNKSYQHDEDYFVHSIGPAVMESFAGSALWEDIANRYDRSQNRRLAEMVYKEFDERPSGLYLPFGKVAKRFDTHRVKRVVWKIVRGLFFKEIGKTLPEDLPFKFEMLSPGEVPSQKYDLFRGTKALGEHPAVFNYRYICSPDKIYIWALDFWNRIIIFVGFHVPGCTCKECTR